MKLYHIDMDGATKKGEPTMNAIPPIEQINTGMYKLLADMQELYKTACRMVDNVTVLNESPEEKWVRAHGEVVNRKTASRLIGCASVTLKKRIDAGEVQTAPNGDVLVRSLAKWATSTMKKEQAMKRRQGVK